MAAKAQATKTQETKAATALSAIQKPVHSPVFEESYDPLFLMQRSAGNQVVQKWAKSVVIQRKIKIGQANDVYEQEADRVADQVMKAENSNQEPGVRRESDIIRMKAG